MSKTAYLRVRLTPDELRRFRRAARKSLIPFSRWVRAVLDNQSNAAASGKSDREGL